MIRKKEENYGPVIIDLTGPDGNAFVLLGIASSTAKQLGYSKKQLDKLLADMKSSDYENLIKVFDDHFGELFILER